MNKRGKSKTRDGWTTPKRLCTFFVSLFTLNIDVAASVHNALCSRFYTEEDDALTKPWTGRVWCNPPYSHTGLWILKAVEEVRAGNAEIVVMLVPGSIGVSWFSLASSTSKWWSFDKRIQFDPPPSIKKSSNNAGSVLFVFTKESVQNGGEWLGIRHDQTGDVLYRAGTAYKMPDKTPKVSRKLASSRKPKAVVTMAKPIPRDTFTVLQPPWGARNTKP